MSRRCLISINAPSGRRTRHAHGVLCMLIGAAAAAIAAITLSETLPPRALAATQPGLGPSSVADIVERLQGAVVNISTEQAPKTAPSGPAPQVPEGSPLEELFEDFLNRRQGDGAKRVNSLGSGVVIDPAGLVVTNNHVIEGAEEIFVNFPDGGKLKVVEIVGRDPKVDLALLRVEPKKPLQAVSFGDSAKMRVGDWVMAIGNPFGLGGSVTVGIISATRRDINAGPYDEFIQTDAAINRGNSGGPLFNMAGEVIGINTAIISQTGGSIGIGFAVPSNIVAQVVDQFRRFGEARRGWLGVRIQTVNEEIAESLGLKTTGGALIASVTPDGPAARAGIRLGDIVLTYDGQQVTAMRGLPKLVAQTEIGREVEITLWRGGEIIKVKAVIEKLDEGHAAEKTRKSEVKPETDLILGLALAPMSDELRSRFEIDSSITGVVVTDVAPGSEASERSIKPGDVILEVTNEKVATPQDIARRVEALRKLKRKTALLLLADAGGSMNYVAVPILK